MEHWEALRPDGYEIVWDDALFRPSTDSFLLSSMPRLKRGLRVCDLGSGAGLLGTLLLQREPSLSVTGLELSPEASELAEKCAERNRLSGRFITRCMDLRDAPTQFASGSFDLVITNPPYYPDGRGVAPSDGLRRQSRNESACSLSELVRTAAYLLRWGGAFCMVHKPERLTDILCVLRDSRCEPKRLRFVQERPDAPPSLILMESRRGGKSGLRVERPLILRNPDGSPSPELDAIYFRDAPS